MWLIGCVCKYGDIFSLAVLIGRGLDQRFKHVRIAVLDDTGDDAPYDRTVRWNFVDHREDSFFVQF